MSSIQPEVRPLRNLRDLGHALTPRAATAGLVAALMGVTGPALLVFQAAQAAGLSAPQIDSWFLAIFAGGGILSLLLALGYRQPICGAFSIAGSALLVEALPRYAYAEAVGAYLVAGLLVGLVGAFGLFGRVMGKVPHEIVMAMLAGVLLRFGLAVFVSVGKAPLLSLAMLVAYLGAQRLRSRIPPAMLALGVGLVLALGVGSVDIGRLRIALSTPVLQQPTFDLEAILSIGLPLALLNLASQNAPGVGILRARGYEPPADGLTVWSGIGSVASALIGGHGLNIAAPMTAICSDAEANRDPRDRYAATVVNGVLFALFGLLGATVIGVFSALPPALVAVVAGLALFPILTQSLAVSVGAAIRPVGSLFAFLIAASGMTLWRLDAPFWALVGGWLVSWVLDRR